MLRYMIELPHTSEECLKTLDEVRVKGSELLPLISWGCEAGNHVGWVVVEAESEAEARDKIVGEFLMPKARITELGTFTVEKIEELHKAA